MARGQPVYASGRYVGVASVAAATGQKLSDPIDISQFSSGLFKLPADYNGDNLTFEGSTTSDGTFVAIHDNSDTAVAITGVTASKWIAFHAAVMSHAYIKIVTNTNLTGARTIELVLKS